MSNFFIASVLSSFKLNVFVKDPLKDKFEKLLVLNPIIENIFLLFDPEELILFFNTAVILWSSLSLL